MIRHNDAASTHLRENQRTTMMRENQRRRHPVGRKVDIELLVGAAEIAERLDVARPGVVHDWRRRHPDFPEPVTIVSRVGLWYWPEVERWARTTGRL
jgi:hypothetical protein